VLSAGSATTKPTGYQGGIPQLTANQPMLTAPPVGRRPGSGGINYGTGVKYTDPTGKVVSDTSTSIADLLAAANANPFNQPANYGLGTTGAGGIRDIRPGGIGEINNAAPAILPLGPVNNTAPTGRTDNSNVSTQMQKDYQSFFDTTKPGSYTDFAGGVLYREPEIQSNVDYQGNPIKQYKAVFFAPNGQQYTLDKNSNLNDIAYTIPEIANAWKGQYGFTPTGQAPASGVMTNENWNPIRAAYADEKRPASKDYLPTPLPAATTPDDYPNIAKVQDKPFAHGGLTNLDHGGFVIPADVVSHFGNGSSDAGLKLLEQKLGATPIRGHGDGMSDSIPASIEGREKALVANEEAYVSPRMVRELGDGDMDEGSRKLARMMEQIRKARTGTKEQGKQINPERFMPGGSVGYAEGGGIKSYAGTADPTSSLVQSGVTGTEQNLSNWIGPYTTNMLGQAQALAQTPYQAYTGPLTAGASDLQSQAFSSAANLAPNGGMATDFAQRAGNISYTPTTAGFNATQAQTYMNPYLQASLEPQLAEARRQSEIANQVNNAAMTKAGAFGGGRQAIMTSENQRNLGSNLANITGQGYNTAYQNAMAQFNADQNRKMQESQFGANLGLQGLQTGIGGLNTANQIGINNLNAQATLGGIQRGIESEGIAADKAQFEEARKDPYTKLQFQQSMLSGLPIAAQNYTMSQPNALQAASGGATTVAQLLKNLGYSVSP
jgi:hypothetical protein